MKFPFSLEVILSYIPVLEAHSESSLYFSWPQQLIHRRGLIKLTFVINIINI